MDADWPYLYAAYLMDRWDDLLPPHLDKEQFQLTVMEHLGSHHFEWIIECKTSNGLRPVGLVYADFRFNGNGIEPHIHWFDWASPRNQLEGVLAFINDVGKHHKIFLYIPDDILGFFERVYKYKTLKKGCKISDCYGRGRHATMYYSPGPF